MQRPKILVIDDIFGRVVPGGRNIHREDLCATFRWHDITNDEATRSTPFIVNEPVCDVMFHRGQVPIDADEGSIVRNDLAGALTCVRAGWSKAQLNGNPPWAMVFLDLCFYTGKVVETGNSRLRGIPHGEEDNDSIRGYFGLSLLEAIHFEFPDLPVMILSSMPREEVSKKFVDLGALGFLDKASQDGPSQFHAALLNHGLLVDPNEMIIGCSLPILLALRDARRLSRHRENLLILGERGTGKELFSRYAHRARCELENKIRPFVTINTAILSPDLFPSELFGIKNNTATGVDGKIGLIETAHGGDLFLDEIGDMQPEVQASVLRVLEDRQFTPIGARESKEVDVRFISATNINLEENKKFRPDLLDRLRAGGTIRLAPLRERKTDIPLLAEYFLRLAEARQNAKRRDITPEAKVILLEYDWPGNVRELQSCIFDAVNSFADVEHLVPRHLRSIVKTVNSKAGGGDSLPPQLVAQAPCFSESFNIDSLLRMQSTICFDSENIATWAGKYGDFEYFHAKMMSHYLMAALEATMKHPIEQPEGVIQIHPALKLMTGNKSLTAKKAYDLIKKILAPLENELDGILKEAFDKAIRNRGQTKSVTS